MRKLPLIILSRREKTQTNQGVTRKGGPQSAVRLGVWSYTARSQTVSSHVDARVRGLYEDPVLQPHRRA